MRAEIEMSSPARPTRSPANPRAKAELAADPEPLTRSWKQRELDAAIRLYKTDRAELYSKLVEGVRAGRDYGDWCSVSADGSAVTRNVTPRRRRGRTARPARLHHRLH